MSLEVIRPGVRTADRIQSLIDPTRLNPGEGRISVTLREFEHVPDGKEFRTIITDTEIALAPVGRRAMGS